MERAFETRGPVTLDVHVAAGEVVIEAEETARTEVTVEPLNDAARDLIDATRIDVRAAGGGGHELRIDVPERRGFFFGHGPQFEVRVRCPAGTRVDLRTRSADVETRGRLGALRAKTASGDVEVSEVAGDADITTASGDVELRSAGGSVTVTTASGDVSIGRCAGRLAATVVSGDLTVQDAGANVETSSVSGDQRIEAVGTGSVSTRSVSGDVTIGVRRGASVWLDVRSLSGDTSSELDLTAGPSATDDAPFVEIRASSVSGDIEIRRAAAGVEDAAPTAGE